MLQFKKVLVPTDLSEYSKTAIPYAVELARAQRGRVTLAHFTHGRVLPESTNRALEGLRSEVAPVESDVIVEPGEPAAGIVELARSQGTDVIVIATHGRTGLARSFMGSTAESVLRHAQCPVMVVRHPAHARFLPSEEPAAAEQPSVMVDLAKWSPTDEDAYFARRDKELIAAARRDREAHEAEAHPHFRVAVHTILVPTDLSPLSLGVLPFVGELARALGASVDLLYVIQDDGPGASSMVEMVRLARTEIEDVRERLLAIGTTMREDYGVACGVFLSFGLPRRAIVKVAKDNHFDLIVMATHGLTGVKRVLMGSTAEAVVRTSPCPVITLRSPAPVEALSEVAVER